MAIQLYRFKEMMMKEKVKELIDYLRVTTKENTSKEQFAKDMEKYNLEDILQAFDVVRKEKAVK